MEHINHSDSEEIKIEVIPQNDQIIVDADQLPNSVLQRLMEEVKNDTVNNMFAYDRAHNRHNRGR
ncbi:MAG TPA: YhhA family cyclophane-containing RiPP [Flavobacterium sp.]